MKNDVLRLLHLGRMKVGHWHQRCPQHEPRYRALLIGINYTGTKNNMYSSLTACVHDVEKMKTLLIEAYGWCETEITVMTDERVAEDALFPTKKNLIKQMKELVQNARPGDTFFLYYAGHSGQRPVTVDPYESDGLDEHLVSRDFKIILDNKLNAILVKPLPPGCRLTASVPCTCYCPVVSPFSLQPTPLSAEVGGDSQAFKPRRATSLPEPYSLALIPVRKAKRYWHVLVTVIRFTARRNRIEAPQLSPIVETDIAGVVSSLGKPKPVPRRNFELASSCFQPPISTTSSLRCCSCSVATSDQNGPAIISLSACKDSQLAWENRKLKGAIMTSIRYGTQKRHAQCLCELLSADPEKPIGDLVSDLRSKLFEVQFRRLWEKTNAKNRRGKNKKSRKKKKDKPDWQRPEVAYEHPCANIEKPSIFPEAHFKGGYEVIEVRQFGWMFVWCRDCVRGSSLLLEAMDRNPRLLG
ncbi:caspase domain-containing protein [Vararia minispora EC-137]|uniref:Caspase domain-containing protein n=1 Tax=Vararia minispora EC-137 TaxID=1314806 RepID=A0ACB8QLC2_9AGAM|nr:caspase domain-containing protein [Vararia minispora EC-137]